MRGIDCWSSTSTSHSSIPAPTTSLPFCWYYEAIQGSSGDSTPYLHRDIVPCIPTFLSHCHSQNSHTPSIRHTFPSQPPKLPDLGFNYISAANSNGGMRTNINTTPVDVPKLFPPRFGRLDTAHIRPRSHKVRCDNATAAAINTRHNTKE